MIRRVLRTDTVRILNPDASLVIGAERPADAYLYEFYCSECGAVYVRKEAPYYCALCNWIRIIPAEFKGKKA